MNAYAKTEKNDYLLKSIFIIISAFSQRSQQSDMLLRVMNECEAGDKILFCT